MFQAYGLYGHIQANRIRSILLLAGFVVLLHALLFSLLLIWSAFLGGTFDEIVAGAAEQFGRSWPIAMIAAAVWFVIAYFAHQTLIGMATGARGVTRAEAPKLYNVLENLCISRGIPMPALQIIDTPALNAYASGLREGQYVIAVTRGLVDTLADDELEAVLAHELTHIRNRDTQLMVIAVIFAGIFAFFGDMIIRGWDFPYGWSPTPRRQRSPWEAQELLAVGQRRLDHRRRRPGRPLRRRRRTQPRWRRRRHPGDRPRHRHHPHHLGRLDPDPLRAVALARVPGRRGLGRAHQEPRRAGARAAQDREPRRLRRALAHGGVLHREPGLQPHHRPARHPPLDRGARRGPAALRRRDGGTADAVTRRRLPARLRRN